MICFFSRLLIIMIKSCVLTPWLVSVQKRDTFWHKDFTNYRCHKFEKRWNLVVKSETRSPSLQYRTVLHLEFWLCHWWFCVNFDFGGLHSGSVYGLTWLLTTNVDDGNRYLEIFLSDMLYLSLSFWSRPSTLCCFEFSCFSVVCWKLIKSSGVCMVSPPRTCEHLMSQPTTKCD